MLNPWLEIPTPDYEGNVSSPKVDQLSLLADQFKESLENRIAAVSLFWGVQPATDVSM